MAIRTFRRLAARIGVVLAASVVGLLPVAPVAAQHAVAAPGEASADAAATTQAFGDARDLGSMGGKLLSQPIVGIANTPTGNGYWLVARDGGVFSFGDATFFGSTGAIHLNQPIVGITRTPTGKGYWFVAADGGVFSFGDARFLGSTGAITLNQPVVGMAATATGNGYWLVARDGGVFSFGDARFLGSTGAITLNQPVVGMAASTSGNGYWFAAADGGVFTFGDAKSFGSAAGRATNAVVGIAPAADGSGYWVGATDGSVFAFGAAPTFGSGAPSSQVVGIAPTPTGKGYWVAAADGAVLSAVSAPAPAAPAPSGSFGFLRMAKDGTPVRYNPCADVHFALNPSGAPAGGVDEVKTAFQRLGTVTGIHFVYDGATDESHVPFGQRKTYQPNRYGNRWAPILITWSSASQEPLLQGGTLGYGGSTSFWSGDSKEAYVTGEVVFDTDQAVLRSGFGPGLTRGNLVMHEIGHVAGLDHTDDRGELLYSSLNSGTPDGYGAGDRVGLGVLGANSGCLTVGPPPASFA